ncbi:MAG: heme NO-binding protein [Deltaproteobacteria bacterium]|jgi:hypothetical protein|nr:heme NO-binding protein [Deltaproteobacteria bacterium]
MYGLVNRAIERLLVDRFGEPLWRRVRDEVDPDLQDFVTMEPYPDQLSFDLIGTASNQTGVPADELLFQLGESWVDFATREGYGDLLELTGATLAEFLQQLDALHTRLGGIFPELRPPSFVCKVEREGLYEVHYSSERLGLAPMVAGLFHGLATRFGTTIEIEHEPRGGPTGHDVFRIRETRG